MDLKMKSARRLVIADSLRRSHLLSNLSQSAVELIAQRIDADVAPIVTTQQISDVHAQIVRRTGHGIDPAIVRAAFEEAGFDWQR